jgi:hypothetical protein
LILALSKFIDWAVIPATTIGMPIEVENPRLKEALEFVNEPDFMPVESQPARVEFNGDLHFRFPTPLAGEFPENNIVYGRLYRCAERWQERPVIVLLHGSNDFFGYKFRFPAMARAAITTGSTSSRWCCLTTFKPSPPVCDLESAGLAALRRGHRAGGGRNSRTDRLAPGGRLPCGGALGHLARRPPGGVDCVPRCADRFCSF